MADPIVFDEFFDSGLEETVSPFLTPRSRRWGKNLSLRASLASAFCLAGAFFLSFHPLLSPLSALLLLLVYFLAGIPKLINSLEDILALNINIDVLMTLAAFLSVLIGSAMEGGLLLVLFAVSGSIEETVTGKAKSAVRSLHKLTPTKAHLVDETGRVHERSIRDIVRGNQILIKAGEIVPLDGIVTEGASSVNLVHLTGESVPAQKKVGDEVPAGATNMEGALVLRVTHTSSDSTLARIIELITEAQGARPKFQRWLDKISRGYALTIISLSALFALGLPWVTSLPYLGFEGSIYRALAFLIAASPCALIIALPIAYLSALSSCARAGILLKGGITLDALMSCKTVAFDKTGTLTTGDLKCLGFDTEKEEILGIAAALEQNAVHPIAQSILRYAEEKKIPPAKITDFRSIPGYGLEAKSRGQYVYIGHPDHIKERLSPDTFQKIQSRAQEIRTQGQLLSLLLVEDQPYFFRFQDAIRPGIAKTLKSLKHDHHLNLLMLTGDHRANAEAIASQIGMDTYYADLKPEDKLDHVARLSADKGLAMVGDGINDAPALARATTGISMGRVGSRTAIDASDVVLLHDNLSLLTWLWRKASTTQAVVRQNVTLATLAIIGASISALFGWIPLWLAVVLHEGGTVIVGLNSLRLLRR
ncbi:MAG: heavy metal translocating P-type ATPase [Parachlamydiales bacterium]